MGKWRFIWLFIALCSLWMVGTAAAERVVHVEVIAEAGTMWEPRRISGGETMGQVFIATDSFNQVLLATPTWTTTNSTMKVTLRKHGPTGDVLHSETILNVVDNGTYVSFTEQPYGRYYVEISDVTGTVGWWTTENQHERGSAYKNGEPVFVENYGLSLLLVEEDVEEEEE